MKKLLFLTLCGICLLTVELKAQCIEGEVEIGIEVDASSESYAEEIYWRLVNNSTNATVEETQPAYLTNGQVDTVKVCLVENESYRLELYDSFGDGWNGAVYRLLYSDGFVLHQGTPTNGLEGENDLEESVVFSAGERLGDDCASPRKLETGIIYNVNTQQYTNNYTTNTLFDSGKEVIYEFVAPLSDVYRFLFTNIGDSVRTSMQLFDGCLDASPTRIDYDTTGLTMDTLSIEKDLAGGNTYFIVISNNPEFTGVDFTSGSLSVNFNSDPLNMNCANSVPLALNGTSVTGRLPENNFSGFTGLSLVDPYGDGYSSGEDSVFYSFSLAAAESIVVQLEGFRKEEKIFLELEKRNSCGEGSLLSYKRVVTMGEFGRFVFDDLTAGNYFVKLFPEDYSETKLFEISLRSVSDITTPVYQNCNNALLVESEFVCVECQPEIPITWLSYFNGTDSGLGTPCTQDSIFAANTADVWVKAKVPSGRNLIVETFGPHSDAFSSPDKVMETRWAAYIGQCGDLTEIFCSDSFEAHQYDTLVNLPADENVYIRLFDRNGDNSGEIGVRLFEPEALPYPNYNIEQNPTSLNLTLSSFYSPFEYGLIVSEDSFDTFLPTYPQFINGNATSYSITDLQPATQYFLKIWTQNGILSNSDTAIVQVKTAPYLISTVQSGDWNDSAVWEGGNIPVADSAVSIQHKVTVSPGSNITVEGLNIENTGDSVSAIGLFLNDADFTVNGDVLIMDQEFSTLADSMGIFIENQEVGVEKNFLVNGNFSMNKNAVNNYTQMLCYVKNTGGGINFSVGNNFYVTYQYSESIHQFPDDVYFEGATLNVGNEISFSNDTTQNYQPLNIRFQNSEVNVHRFNVLDSALNTSQKFNIIFSGNSQMNLTGDFSKQKGGLVKFLDNTSLNLVGTNYQSISGFDPSIGQDSTIINNLVLDNVLQDTEANPTSLRRKGAFSLDNTQNSNTVQLFINGEISFVNGVFVAMSFYEGSQAKLLMSSQSSVNNINGPNQDSFVRGRVDKIGVTDFTFPIGNEYGPRLIGLKNISALDNSSVFSMNAVGNHCLDSTFTVSGVSNIREEDFWLMEAELSENNITADIELLFNDFSAENITDLASLQLLTFDNGGNLGNGSLTANSFVVNYNFENGTQKTLGLGSLSAIENNFYQPLAIESISANVAKPGDALTIFYSSDDANNGDKVYLGDVQATTLSSTANSLTFEVPVGARSGEVLVYRANGKAIYSLVNLSISDVTSKTIVPQNYDSLTIIDNLNIATFGKSQFEISQIDNNIYSDIVASTGTDSLKIVKNIGGSMESDFVYLENTPTGLMYKIFSVAKSNLTNSLTSDLFAFYNLDNREGFLYLKNDGNGNFTLFNNPEEKGEGSRFNSPTFWDSNSDGYTDVSYSFLDPTDNFNAINTSNSESDCSVYGAGALVSRADQKQISSLLYGAFLEFPYNMTIYYVQEAGVIYIYDPYNNPAVTPGTFLASTSLSEFEKISVNNDDKSQIAAIDSVNNTLEVFDFYSNGTINRLDVSLGFKPGKMAIEDVNGDGFPDVIISDRNTADVYFYLNSQSGSFEQSIVINYGISNISDLDIADLNGDGEKDIVLLQENGNLSIAYYKPVNPAGAPVISSANITTTGFDLSWPTVPEASSYEILISLNNDSTASLATDSIFALTDSTLTFNAPVPFQTYYVFGRSINAAGDSSSYSSPLTVDLIPLNPPVINISDINSNGFNLNFDPVEGASSFEVFIGLSPDSLDSGNSFIIVNDTIFNFSAPEYSEKYYFYGRSIANAIDTSGFTAIDSVKLPVSNYLEQDSLALVSLYNSTNGVNWNNNENWLLGKVNTWNGITMAGDTVRSLALSNNQLEGELPDSIALLNFVTQMDFSLNTLTSLGGLDSLTAQLEELNVSGNNINFENLDNYISIPNFIYADQNYQYALISDTLVNLHSNSSFEIGATATSNQYQWYKNGDLIAGADNITFAIDSAQKSDEGLYYLEITNTDLPGLTLFSDTLNFKVSTLERDMAALRVLYQTANGDSWSSIQWDTTAVDPASWNSSPTDIVVENNRVVEVNLPNNNLSGEVPQLITEILGLRTLDLANNAIVDMADLSGMPSLTELDISGNALGYEDLEPNMSIAGLLFSPQAKLGDPLREELPVGSSYEMIYSIGGTANSYQWLRNGQAVSGAVSDSLLIDSLSYQNMGSYELIIKNEIVNSVNPDFELSTHVIDLLATANVNGHVADLNNIPTESGNMLIFGITTEGAFDTVAFANNQVLLPLDVGGNYELSNLVLGDYLIFVKPNKAEYPDLLNTYWTNTIDWDDADTLFLRNNMEDVDVTIQGTPQPLSGTSVFSGYLEEELGNETGRVLPRERVSGAGVSVRRISTSTKDITGFSNNGELIAYLETDENGEFSFEGLAAGEYTVKIDYPGVPMDQSSDLSFTLTGENSEALEVAAVVENGVCSIETIRYTANKLKNQKYIQVHPNPVDDLLTIMINDEHFNSITILDINGRVIERVNEGFRKKMVEVIDMSAYESGVYVLQVLWKNGTSSSSKIIKK
ncbi:VCBS repeat-containing protein [Marivirga sp. S37H4]|uniref:VCBS repeat-containing protein n=1 Tax=Marivirga aurantiaca TaxID=2802615 RepID=A0A934X119_9BACT|nr:T9SS type A sorting domain-containing protein [Marivirga aurantiaca]MBK6266445.1 VCBS repeat-containing protein [Marivirga aurantiaca]